MIRLVEALPPQQGDELLLCRVQALWECYGAVPFIRYYVGDSGSVAALFDGQALVYAVPEEREELAWFVAMQPDITSLLSDPDTAAAVAAAWQGEVATYPVMRYEAQNGAPAAELAHVSPRELYAFLQPIFPHLAPFDVWYPDICFRERHGFCRNVAVCEAGIPISSAMTVAEWQGGALIGGVATTPVYRQRGLAGLCVGSLATALQAEGRQVYICPKNDGAERLYTKLGFVTCSMIAQTERT
ncbi:MAG: GNAT family N-acetyltransferase [Clostridia bacterium]|nr:GNAT family N-acetyltransferase [Clostridia bacterium]